MGSATFGKKTLGRQTFCQPPQYNERLVDPQLKKPNFDGVLCRSNLASGKCQSDKRFLTKREDPLNDII